MTNQEKFEIKTIKTIGTSFLIVALIYFTGCNHENFPSQSDIGHIETYLLNEDHAEDLLRTDGVFPGTPYQWPGSALIYYDSVLGIERSFDTYVSDTVWNYSNPIGWVRESVSRVVDNYTVRTFRINGTDTTFTDTERQLIRSAILLKLAPDSYYYFGWSLWGVGYYQQTLPPVVAALWFADSSSIRADFDLYNDQLKSNSAAKFRSLTSLKAIADSTETRLDVTIANVGSPKRYFTRISYTSSSGYVSKRLDLIDAEHATGTFILHEKPKIAYDFIVISLYDTVTKEFIKAWTVPYRVNPA